MNVFSRFSFRYFALLLSALCTAGGAGSAIAAADPDSVSFKLDGCRLPANTTLPNTTAGPYFGKFICNDSAYTTGNLGKSWDELDLVPFRITATAGNAAPTTQTYAVAIALDNLDGGKPGYDVMGSDGGPGGAPVLNTSLSDATCTALTSTAQQTLTPGVGGIDQTIYRVLTITQATSTTCVYDWYGRLALGSHLFAGSSLHANLLNQNLSQAGIGSKEVSIPVNEISPQELSKNMAAKQDTDHIWNLTKEPSPAKVQFDNVCAADAPTNLPVTITVTWTKLAAKPGFITVVTNISATNPASRTVTVNVSDTIYEDSAQTTPLDTATTPVGGVDVPANTSQVVLTHTATLPAADGSIGGFLNDVATANYTDKVTGVPIPGQTTAMANAQIALGTESNTSATITDSESISGNALTFSVATPSVGNFTGGYIAGTPTTGPVGWDSGNQADSGNIAFSKTLYLDGKTITSGKLSDTATLTASDAYTTSADAKVTISSNASVALTISKTIPDVLEGNEKLEVTFHVTRTNDASYSHDETLTFLAGNTTKSVTLNGLVPDTYTVKETGNVFYPANYPTSPSQSGLLSPQGGDSQDVNISANANGVVAKCAGTASFNNVLAQGFAHAQVKKITDPNPDTTGDPWTFTLKNPFGATLATAVINANTGYADFAIAGTPVDLAQEGTYTVTETTETGWDLASGVANPCTFTVEYPASTGKVYQCSFTNIKRGKAKVVKTVGGSAPTAGQSFTFQLREGASTVSDGTIDESIDATVTNGGTFTFSTLLVPGNHYQVCEIVMPGWNTTLGTSPQGALFVPNSIVPPSLPNPNVNNMTVCVDFTVTAGQTQTFTVNNSPPPGGRALTIGFWKNWASCANSGGKQKPTLDTTLYGYLPAGIPVGNVKSVFKLDASSKPALGLFGQTALSTPDCPHAVSLLNKTDFSGKKQASDPLFNMAAQLVGAELNVAAGAGVCGPVVNAYGQANVLLGKYKFDGFSYTGKLSAADSTLGNCLATWLDDYNNDRATACSVTRTCP